MKKITYVTTTIGSLDVVVNETPNYQNTFEIGNKRIDFSLILPADMNLHEHDYHIIMFEGVYTRVEIVVGNKTYTGVISNNRVKYEELLTVIC